MRSREILVKTFFVFLQGRAPPCSAASSTGEIVVSFSAFSEPVAAGSIRRREIRAGNLRQAAYSGVVLYRASLILATLIATSGISSAAEASLSADQLAKAVKSDTLT